MATKEDWEQKIEAAGGKNFSTTVYAKEYLDNFDVLDYHWMDSEEEDNLKIRNKFARELRKDGFKVKAFSSPCMGRTFYNLEAERYKGQ
jgi:hypothetical protein